MVFYAPCFFDSQYKKSVQYKNLYKKRMGMVPILKTLLVVTSFGTKCVYLQTGPSGRLKKVSFFKFYT